MRVGGQRDAFVRSNFCSRRFLSRFGHLQAGKAVQNALQAAAHAGAEVHTVGTSLFSERIPGAALKGPVGVMELV